MKNSFLSIAKLLLGWPLTLLAFYFLWKLFASQTNNLSFRLSDIHGEYLLISIIFFTIYFLARCFLWQSIITSFNHTPSLITTAYYWSVSEIKRYVPGNIWSYLGRGVLFASLGMTKRELFLGFFLEVQLIVIATIILSLPAISYLLHIFFPHMETLFFVLICLGTFILVLGFVFQQVICTILPQFLKKIASSFIIPLTPHLLSKLSLQSLLVFLLFGLGYLFSAFAFGIIGNVTLIISLFIFSFVVGYISILTPSGLGVREGMIATGLATFLPPEQALAIAILGRGCLTLAEVIALGISYILYKRNEKGTHITTKR